MIAEYFSTALDNVNGPCDLLTVRMFAPENIAFRVITHLHEVYVAPRLSAQQVDREAIRFVREHRSLFAHAAVQSPFSNGQ